MRLSSYCGPQHNTDQELYLLLIFLFHVKKAFASCWQRILPLWGQNVLSSYYRKLQFRPFGTQLYFVWHDNKVNCILESFANEILKPVSVIKLSAMLLKRTEEEGRREAKYIKSGSYPSSLTKSSSDVSATKDVISTTDPVEPQGCRGEAKILIQNGLG